MKNTNKNQNDQSRTFYIKGMHCPSCEVLITKELTKMDGVTHAQVSLKRNCVVINSEKNNFPSVVELNESFEKYGYSFSTHQEKKEEIYTNDTKKIVAIFLCFVFVFYIFEKSGILMNFNVSSNSSLVSYFLFGLVAGLSSCAALVGGILLSLSKQWNEIYNGNTKKSALPFIYFNTSRVLAFGVFGSILGFVGQTINLSITASSIFTILITLLMLVIGLQMLGVKKFKGFKIGLPKSFSLFIADETKFKGKFMPIIVGALTFFVPRGFTLIAQTNALGSGSPSKSALMLVAFALGTLPMLLLISFSSVKFYSNPAFAKKFNIFSGLLIIFFALYTLNSQLNVLGFISLNDLPKIFNKPNVKSLEVTNSTSTSAQIMQMEATAFEYFPNVINIKAGVPTTWEIYNNGAVGCAQAVYARGLYPNVIYLKPGMNTVEFTPKTPGSYKVSCSMGMVPPITVNVY